jgi:uncharacterized protein (DUF1697 family)
VSRQFAFLRAINVGGRVVAMERLRVLFAELGFSNVETYIASGNVIFEARTAPTRKGEARIEAHLEQSLGYEVATFLRTPAELSTLRDQPPFAPDVMVGAVALNIGFLREAPGAAAASALLALATPDDNLHIKGREFYWLSRKKQSESLLSNRLFEKALGMPATLRGRSTIEKLLQKYPLP